MSEQRGIGRILLWRILPLGAVGLIILLKIFSADKATNPITGEKHRVALSVKDEQVLGLQSYREVLSQSQPITSGAELELVRRVAERLARATGSAGEGFSWEVSLLRSPSVNAFCLPGGKIAVYTGILPITRTEAGLAAVMGHEMAHAIARHGSQRLFQQDIYQTAMAGAALSLGDMDPQQRRTVLGLLGAGAQFGIILPFSRDHESEADAMGLLFMARAGYDPRESIQFWSRMSAAGAQQPPEFMSTHPSDRTRIERLEQLLPGALAEYEKAARR